MFEGQDKKKQEEIINTFNKYKGLLAEYVDKMVYDRMKLDRYVSDEDKKKIAERKRTAERKNDYENYETHLRAKIFEGILVKHGGAIFGKNAEMIITSEYDDWENGTDMVLKGLDDGGKIATRIAIDAALSMDTRNIETKNKTILDALEYLDQPGSNDYFSLKYFPESEGGTKEIRCVPRAVLGIHSNDFTNVLDEVRKGSAGMLELRRIFLTMIKRQLENQFVLLLGLNGEKMNAKENEGGMKKFRPSVVQEVKELYPLSEDAVKSDWEEGKMEHLFSSFEKNWTIFSMKHLSLPVYAKMLSSVANAWEWTRRELLDAEAQKVLSETDTSWNFENNEVVQKLESHLDKERALKHRPFLVT